jgi:lipopolysaccharide/colanic/teichoic acid biosynthesis glycosyltransferase
MGLNGEPINIYKIRTMVIGADKQLETLVSNGFDSFGKIVNDPRITPVGRILRKYWMDELPQLCNLARGDIKLVGIRPKSESFWRTYPSEIMEKSLRQKPGLLAIEYAFAHTDSFEDKLQHMTEYLDMWEKEPQETDRMYFSMIIKNIIFGGIRSK